MFAWLKSRGRFLRLFDIVIAPSIAQCCSGDPVGPSKFTGDAKAPDGQPPRGLLFIMRPQRPRAWRRAPTIFFDRSSFNAALSSMDSASSFLSLRFSSSSVLSRFASDTWPSSCTTSLLRLGCLPRRAHARAEPRWRRRPGFARRKPLFSLNFKPPERSATGVRFVASGMSRAVAAFSNYGEQPLPAHRH